MYSTSCTNRFKSLYFSIMKNVLKVFIFILLAAVFFGCSRNKEDSKTLKILCTTFPVYDWTLNITKNVPDIEVSLLMDKGTDLHNFQPSVDDIIKISGSDILIYNGGESDEWIEKVLKESPNKKLVSINLMQNLKQDELIDEEEDDDDLMQLYEVDRHFKQLNHHHKHEEIKDEHIWLSLHFAKDLVKVIEKNICASSKTSDENRKIIKTNTDSYIKQIEKIEEDTLDLIKKNSVKIVIADRNPFVYLAKDFKMKIHAAFNGCSAETEASFETIINLTEILNEYKINTIFVTESSDRKLAQTLIKNSNTDIKIEVLDSMQSINRADIEKGAAYTDIMKKNINTIKKAVNK